MSPLASSPSAEICVHQRGVSQTPSEKTGRGSIDLKESILSMHLAAAASRRGSLSRNIPFANSRPRASESLRVNSDGRINQTVKGSGCSLRNIASIIVRNAIN